MDRPLIVGAGPVGVGAALFLSRAGINARLVEVRGTPVVQSKALGVNPRTLELLEPTGVTASMLEYGRPVRGMQFHRDGRLVAEVSLEGIHSRYPYLLGLSQGTTERLLTEALAARGGAIERGVEMIACRNVPAGVEIELRHVADDRRETVQAPWLLAADGAHSTARKQLDVPFEGAGFPVAWHMCDVSLDSKLAVDFGHIYFLPERRFLFLLPVYDDARVVNPAGQVWRVLGNFPDPLAALQEARPAAPPLWQSSFHVAHKINARLSSGQVYFAGDAAHIHSPMGARGMNLGLEDAWVFAHLAAQARLAEYHDLRHPVDAKVVSEVKFFSRLVNDDSWYTELIRKFVFPKLVESPLQGRIKRTVTGLDHELPA